MDRLQLGGFGITECTEEARLMPDTELMEFICNENNVDLQHLSGKSVQ
jgi:hypothetical protein